jgi:hypothetical protein
MNAEAPGKYHPQDLQWAARIALVARIRRDPRYAELIYRMQHATGLDVQQIELNIVALARNETVQ